MSSVCKNRYLEVKEQQEICKPFHPGWRVRLVSIICLLSFPPLAPRTRVRPIPLCLHLSLCLPNVVRPFKILPLATT